ncbi:MAG: flagellar hook-basal body complex protein, partial [Candidatus Eremiobacterota bacterium]
GWMAQNGVVDPTQPLSSLRIPLGESMIAQPTTTSRFIGNLDGSAALYNPGPPESGGKFVTQLTVYDSMGQDYRVDMTFTKTAPAPGVAAAWNWQASLGGVPLGNGTIAFDAQGAMDPANSTPAPVFTFNPTNGANPVSVVPDFTAMTQLVTPGQYSVIPASQDGFPAGALVGYSIDRSGMIVGRYSNALARNLGQVALAYFANPQGLEKGASGLSLETANSGKPQLGPPGSSPRGELTAGALEMSNVDLSTEFTRLITAQRAFQANSRVITTMDEVLGEVANLRR